MTRRLSTWRLPLAVIVVLTLARQDALRASSPTIVGCTDGVGDVPGLIAALEAANTAGTGDIELSAACTYTLESEAATSDLGFWFGPTGLPVITSTVVIEGNGATIARDPAAPPFRLFAVAGPAGQIPSVMPIYPSAGALTLQDLTLTGGLAQGGAGGGGGLSTGGASASGGGGAGLGGALFVEGAATLSAVTLTGNVAQGGPCGSPVSGDVSGGGGGGLGGAGAAAVDANSGGGGGGFIGAGAVNGGGGAVANANGTKAGGANSLGEPWDGDAGVGGGGDSADPSGGFGGGGAGGVLASAGGNGGIGGGGGGGTGGGGSAGSGGFGGGGGGSPTGAPGNGGFGAGGGSGLSTMGLPGFGGGAGTSAPGASGGAGGGLGGAVFVHGGTLTASNVTFSGNTVQDGTALSNPSGCGSGDAYGGGLFVLGGTATLSGVTMSGNNASSGGVADAAAGADLYVLTLPNEATTQGARATLSVIDSILGSTGGASDCESNGATVTSQGHNVVYEKGSCSFKASGDLTGKNPNLGLLANNGGPVETMAPQAGSPAIGNGSCAEATDARGLPREPPCTSGAYQQSQYTATISVTGPGFVSSSVSGFGCGDTCSSTPLDPFTQIMFTETPGPFATFSGWGGDCATAAADGGCTVTVVGPVNVTAAFASVPELLSVQPSGAGGGTVTSVPAGIDCGQLCASSFNGGTQVVLTAMPNATSVFGSWTGACTGSTDTCTVTMTQAQSVTATFNAAGADAGPQDAGVIDAGSVDAGTPDAGMVDAGAPDAGQAVDAGTHSVDGGMMTPSSGGCGCGSTAPAQGLLLLLVMLATRRRRGSVTGQ